MRNIKLVLEYDGSAFFGFQRQPHHPTVQEALESALSKLLNQKTKIAAASGRTDTGVHAECQVVNFKTDSRLSSDRIQRGLNSLLPKQIAAKSVTEAGPDFHARYGVRSKLYEYRVYNHPIRSPLKMARVYHVPGALNLRKMRQAAKILQGRHDFRAFGSSRNGNTEDKKKRTVRTIYRLQVIKQGAEILFQIEGDGFLYKMVRNLVGSLIEIGLGNLDAADLNRILASRDRRLAGAAAPPQGLSLVKVTY